MPPYIMNLIPTMKVQSCSVHAMVDASTMKPRQECCKKKFMASEVFFWECCSYYYQNDAGKC